jgi:tetratricopeptide (TPR) repeat protein
MPFARAIVLATLAAFYFASPVRAQLLLDRRAEAVVLQPVQQSVDAGNVAEARRRLERLAPQQRASARGQLLEATVLHQEGEFLKSLTLAPAVIEQEPGNAAAYKLFALDTAQLGKPELAEPYFQQAVALAPQDAQARHYWGVNLTQLSRPAEAIEQLKEAMRLDPQSLHARYALGIAYEMKGAFGEAKTIYREAMLAAANQEIADVIPFLYLGRLLAAEERWDEAAECFRQATQINSKDGPSWYQYGRALLSLNKFEEALSAIDKASSLEPSDPRPHYQRMLALKLLGRMPEAREAGRNFERLRQVNQAPTTDTPPDSPVNAK